MSLAKTIEVSFDMTFADLYKGTLATSIYVLRYLIRAVCVMVALWAVCLVVGSLRSGLSGDADALAQWLFPFVVGSVPTVLIFIPAVPFVRVRKMLRTEGVKGNRRYIFSDDGVQIESKVANASAKWAAYVQIRETRQYFLLFAAPGFANILPKRCFLNESAIAEFRSLVRGHVRRAQLRQ
jgi:hypothetical protein